MKHYYLFFALFASFQVSCSKRATIQFTQKKPELTSADVLTEIMLVNKSPRIVLRVPNTRKGVTNTQSTSNQPSEVINHGPLKREAVAYKLARLESKNPLIEQRYDETALYNAIEKQLFKEGFSVRDRGLFNQVLDDNKSLDYSKIKDFTNTDLILELVSIESLVGYTTNVCYTHPDGKQRIINEYRNPNGASVEFKLVHVKTNEIIGSYKIHYTPCLEGCRGLYAKKGQKGVFISNLWLKPGEKELLRQDNRKAYERLDQDQLEAFIAGATQQLVQSMRY